ncbi:uncharacterized protein LOC128173025 [Crassostrea angulata]|uniref:uncharacterized protein LOC128173025 n=1 Tax=Magallana angulata TaxID=2784310 RepID=UPI0022B2054A|nr:uncharacterized protein LOC128173025 [Crassostrea angulata]
MPRQGKNKRPNVSCVQGHNESSSEGEEREWLNERVTEKENVRVNKNVSKKKRKQTERSDSDSSSDSDSGEDDDSELSESELFNPSQVLQNKGDLVKNLNSFFGQGPRTTDSSLGATITEGSSAKEGGATEEPPDLQHLQGKQRISKSG